MASPCADDPKETYTVKKTRPCNHHSRHYCLLLSLYTFYIYFLFLLYTKCVLLSTTCLNFNLFCIKEHYVCPSRFSVLKERMSTGLNCRSLRQERYLHCLRQIAVAELIPFEFEEGNCVCRFVFKISHKIK
jgi:hypothetical protein